jgi:hypothetical protein
MHKQLSAEVGVTSIEATVGKFAFKEQSYLTLSQPEAWPEVMQSVLPYLYALRSMGAIQVIGDTPLFDDLVPPWPPALFQTCMGMGHHHPWIWYKSSHKHSALSNV